VRGLHFSHASDERPQVGGVSFVLRAGRTLGVLGANESGKTTLAQLLLGNLRPASGDVLVSGRELEAGQSSSGWRLPVTRILLMLSIFAGFVLAWASPAWFLSAWSAGGYAVPLFFATLEAARLLRAYHDATARAERPGWAPASARAAGVGYISSEHAAGQDLDPKMTIEEAIAREMPLANKEARRKEVVAALRVSGFQMFTESGKPTGTPESYLADGVTVGQCSGGALPSHSRAPRRRLHPRRVDVWPLLVCARPAPLDLHPVRACDASDHFDRRRDALRPRHRPPGLGAPHAPAPAGAYGPRHPLHVGRPHPSLNYGALGSTYICIYVYMYICIYAYIYIFIFLYT